VATFTEKTKDHDAYVHLFLVLLINEIFTNPFFDTVIEGTAALFTGKGSPIGLDNFSEILNRGYTIIDKTLLIADFIRCSAIVSLVVRPRRFGKTINLTMLRDFFSIPVHPDNENYRRELFRDTKMMKEEQALFDEHFCKYPVIFLSLKVCYLLSRLDCYCVLFC
jgi:hypothetical protein